MDDNPADQLSKLAPIPECSSEETSPTTTQPGESNLEKMRNTVDPIDEPTIQIPVEINRVSFPLRSRKTNKVLDVIVLDSDSEQEIPRKTTRKSPNEAGSYKNKNPDISGNDADIESNGESVPDAPKMFGPLDEARLLEEELDYSEEPMDTSDAPPENDPNTEMESSDKDQAEATLAETNEEEKPDDQNPFAEFVVEADDDETDEEDDDEFLQRWTEAEEREKNAAWPTLPPLLPDVADHPNPNWCSHVLAALTEERPGMTKEELDSIAINPHFGRIPTHSIKQMRKCTNFREMHAIMPRCKDKLIELPGLGRLADISKLQDYSRRLVEYYTANPGAQSFEAPSGDVAQKPSATGIKPIDLDPNMPVLYKVIGLRPGKAYLLESVHYETSMGCEELRYITLDRKSWDKRNDVKGIFQTQLAIGDFVWVNDLTIPDVFLKKGTIKAGLESACTRGLPTPQIEPLFRASKFELVTPATKANPRPCYMIHAQPGAVSHRRNHQLAVMGEGRAVRVSHDLIVDQHRSRFTSNGLYMCTARQRISGSRYLCSIPISKEAEAKVLEYIRNDEPTQFTEAPTPTMVYRMADEIWEQYQDKIDTFRGYRKDPNLGCAILKETLTLGISAEEAKENEARDTRQWLTSVSFEQIAADGNTVIRAHFEIEGKTTEGDWTKGADLIISLVGDRPHPVMARLSEMRFSGSPINKAHCSAIPSLQDVPRLVHHLENPGPFPAKVYLLDEQTRSWIQKTLSKGFRDLTPTDPAYQTIDIIYGTQRGRAHLDEMPTTQKIPQLTPDIPSNIRIDGRNRPLTATQQMTIALLASKTPIGALQAPFGTGKTTSIAAAVHHVSRRPEARVVVTATTNNAVAQLTDAILRLNTPDNQRNVHRYRAEALTETITTRADIVELAGELLNDRSTRLSSSERKTLRTFIEGRRLIMDYMANLLTDPEQITKAERAMMLESAPGINAVAVYELINRWKPSHILAATIDSLIGLSEGLWEDQLKEITAIVIDEASLLSEAAFIALTCHFPKAQIFLVGDIRQSRPFTTLGLQSWPMDFGLRASLAVALNARTTPTIFYEKSWRSHPHLMSYASELFYSARLTTDVKPEDRPVFRNLALRLPTPGAPCVFVVYEGIAERSTVGSLSNVQEARHALEILKRIRASCPNEETTLISYYNAQTELLEQMTRNTTLANVRKASVERSQGSETGITLLLTTRSSAAM
ncbi:unnamed protein product, partial [Mesorhabditis spiculigera]